MGATCPAASSLVWRAIAYGILLDVLLAAGCFYSWPYLGWWAPPVLFLAALVAFLIAVVAHERAIG